MQANCESTRGGRALISVFVAFTVAAMVAWNLPNSKLKREGLRVAGPYVRATGLDQNWSVFAPNPYRDSSYLVARITYADGTKGRWEVPEGSAAVGAYWDYRWGKWAEWTLARSHSDLCKGTATYVANREADEGKSPVRIDLVRRSRDTQRPGIEPGHGAWRETVVCVSTVTGR